MFTDFTYYGMFIFTNTTISFMNSCIYMGKINEFGALSVGPRYNTLTENYSNVY
jgi:hypothetical protein